MRTPHPSRTPMRVATLLVWLSLWIAAGCSDSEAPATSRDAATELSGDANASDAADAREEDADVGPPDTDLEDVSGADIAPDIPAGLGAYGEPCQSNLDCESGYCVPSAFGFVCSALCSGACEPVGELEFRCESVVNAGGDAVQVCLPVTDRACAPCLDDANCPGGACVDIGGSQVCGVDCATSEDCAGDTVCFPSVRGEPLQTPQCLPETLACDCSEDNEGETRPCARADAEGRSCTGVETCDPRLGWVGCDAPLPGPELCDGIDNDCNGAVDDGVEVGLACTRESAFGVCEGISFCDGEAGPTCRAPEPIAEVCDFRDNNCDGEVDEGFVDDEGRYVSDTDCGACGNDCADQFPEGYVAECALVEGEPSCVVTACPPGFVAAGPRACVPLDSALCLACTTDDDCNTDVGDRCLSYGDASFCGRDCGPTSVFGDLCPEGYTCESDQCVRSTGSCGCDAGDSFDLPCALESPSGDRCIGRQRCEDGAVGACEPPEELCNGVDDDCDGEVDEGFVDDAGAYTLDAHCGACFQDCAARGGDNASGGRCVLVGDDALCEPVCSDGFFDADGLAFNGCECAFISDEDEPDALGIDANCDGVDGIAARGVFVARTGSDASGDGSLGAPYATIQVGIDAAIPGTRDAVFVAAGVYDGSVALREGVSVYGGYGFDFSTRDILGNETAIVGGTPTEDAVGAVNAAGIRGAVTVLAGFTIVGADALAAGASSYAVHALDCTSALTLRDNRVRAGNGAAGLAGGSGGDGAAAALGSSSYVVARQGSAPEGAGGFCPSPPLPSLAGGAGAQHICLDGEGAAVAANGGAGALSGCPTFPDTPNNAGTTGASTPGSAPGRPSISGGSGGGGGTHLRNWSTAANLPPNAPCNLCIVPSGATATIQGQGGANGARGDDGVSGAGCAAGSGSLEGALWAPGSAAGLGGRGGAGSGGGGGGAGGGVGHCTDASCPVTDERVCIGDDTLGGSGGGGGAGGCGGEGGLGGGPGGGSFGVFLAFTRPPESLPRIDGNELRRGFGGSGGSGGAGGSGGGGSEGAPGLASATLGCPGQGGTGGDGGPGGPGGGGGGGCAGPSVAIWAGGAALPGDTAAWAADNSFPATGAAGAAGQGGPSAGAVGDDAAAGLYEVVLPCAGGEVPPCR